MMLVAVLTVHISGIKQSYSGYLEIPFFSKLVKNIFVEIIVYKQVHLDKPNGVMVDLHNTMV